MRRPVRADGGFTLIELLVTMLLLGTVAAAMLTLFVSLVRSSIVAKRQAVASTLATNQMEYLKSLPYNSLAIAGGSIYSANPLPASTAKTLNGVKYTVTSSVSYVDDAFDGCGSYPSQTLKQLYCRNYPPPSGATTDSNPADYKIIQVKVTGPSGDYLADLNTQVAARVAETASTTGALFVSVIDDTGNPVSGGSVSVVNSSVVPAVSVADSTDSNGIAIFYGLPPDTSGNDYTITATKSGYSTLTTIKPNGSLQPNYASQNILTQSSSYVTLAIKQTGSNSLVVETTDTAGNPLANVKVYAKGGYKRYTATTDTSYCFDNLVTGNLTNCATSGATDTRPTTDGSGLASISNLVPGAYIFCGDSGATNCKAGTTQYYVAAAIPYGGNNSFNPITVPTYDATDPPATTYSYNGVNYLQKVRLVLTPSSSFPRVTTMTPDDVSLSTGNPSSFAFTITGVNLPCSANASSCSTTVKFIQGSTYTASCTGDSTAVQLNCTVNIAGATSGSAQLAITSGGNTLTLPASLPLGGLSVNP